MKNYLLSLLASIIFLNANAQEHKLTPYFLKQDLALFESLLKIHPGLHEYTTEENLNLLISETKQEIEKSLTPLEFYKNLSIIVSNLQDANTRLYAGRNIYNHNTFYPILFKPIGESLYADIEDQNIPVGSKLISINGISC